MIYRFVTTRDFMERSRSAGGSTERQQDQSVKAENLIDRTHNSLKAERYLCRISMPVTFNIFQIYFMAACHTNICYPIHLAATLFHGGDPTMSCENVRLLVPPLRAFSFAFDVT
jgi:hypothetical protein